MISYIEFYHTIDWVNFEKLFAWVSNVDEINWIVLEVKNPPIYYVGNLVLYKGIYQITYYIVVPPRVPENPRTRTLKMKPEKPEPELL